MKRLKLLSCALLIQSAAQFAVNASADTTIYEGKSFPRGLYVGMSRSELIPIADNGNCNGNVSSCVISSGSGGYVSIELENDQVSKLTTNDSSWTTSAGAKTGMSPAEVAALYPNSTSDTNYLRETVVEDKSQGYTYFFKRRCYFGFCSVSSRHSIYAAGGTDTKAPDGETVIRDISANTYESKVFTVDVPAGSDGLSVVMSKGSGDADLYVKKDSQASVDNWDCRPYLDGNNESCSVMLGMGTYYISVRAYKTFEGVQLKITK